MQENKTQDEKVKVKKQTWFNTKFLPTISKLGNQRHLASIRDTFGTLIPIIIAGAIGILFTTIVFGGFGSENVSLLGLLFMFTHWTEYKELEDGANIAINMPDWNNGLWNEISQIGTQIFSPLNSISIGMLSIYVAYLMGYFIAKTHNFKSPLLVGIASLAVFGILAGFNTFFVDSDGLLTALIGSVATAELYIVLSKKMTVFRDGESVVQKSLNQMLPFLLTLLIFTLFNTCIWSIANFWTQWSVNISNVTVVSFFAVNQDGYHILSDIDFATDELSAMLVDEPSNVVITNAIDLVTQWGTFYDSSIIITSGNIELANQSNDVVISSIYDGLKQISVDYDSKTISLALSQVLVSNSENLGKDISVETLVSTWEQTTITYDADPNVVQTSLAVFNYYSVAVETEDFSLGAFMYLLIQAPFLSFVNSGGGLPVALLYSFMASFLWFFGVNGGNVLNGVFGPIWLAVLATNIELFTSMGNPELSQEYMTTYSSAFFSTYMSIGGVGATLALITAVLMYSKRNELKVISKLAAPAGLFQINEPVIFGFPIVLNFTWLFPFLLTPLVCITWGSIGVALNLVYPSYILTPWTAPWFIGALLANGFQSPFWSLFFAFGAFILAYFIYLPFVILDNRKYVKQRRNGENVSQEEKDYYRKLDYKKDSIKLINSDFENGLIDDNTKTEYLNDLKVFYDEMLPIIKAQYLATCYIDELQYLEKQFEQSKSTNDNKELKISANKKTK